MRTPGFWYRPPGLEATLLSPLSLLWQAGAALRARRHPAQDLPIPAVLVGNLVAGGAGKTPAVLALTALARQLLPDPHAIAIVSRGYGGRLPGPARVDPVTHDAAAVGDEPLLLAAAAPVIVARDRLAGIATAAQQGAQLVLLDDGFQNPALARAARLLVVDGPSGFGNGCLMPAGPLRQRVDDGLDAAAAILLVGEDRHALLPRLQAGGRRPVWRAQARMSLPPDIAPGQRVAAFAGLARPEKFFDGLRRLGLDVALARGFADHRPYTEVDMAALVRDAGDLPLLTTRKDAVRVPAAWQDRIRIVDLALDFADPAAPLAWLQARI